MNFIKTAAYQQQIFDSRNTLSPNKMLAETIKKVAPHHQISKDFVESFKKR